MSWLAQRGVRAASNAIRVASTSTPSVKAVNFVPSRLASQNFSLPYGVREAMFKMSGYNQYGLYKDDILAETDEVIEAVRRLSPQAQDERLFRIQRAIQCSLMKTVLPKDQWPSYDEDLEKGRYLQDLLAEVEREKAEQSEWDNRV